MAEVRTVLGESDIDNTRETARRQEAFWYRILPHTLYDAFMPARLDDIKLSNNESIKLVIYQSWYRNLSGYLFVNYGLNLFLITILASLVIGFFGWDTGLFQFPLWNMAIPLIIFGAWLLYALVENFRYLKWRMVLTDRRLIFSTPQNNNWLLSDHIEFKGQPKVIDDNWSNDRLMRNLQIITRSRDLTISPVGLQFDGGQVKDGLVMPDVDLDHIEEFKQLVLKLTE